MSFGAEVVNQIANVVADICKTLNNEQVSEVGIQQISFPLPAGCSTYWLEWLAAQSHYPQFYWHHREGHEEVAACGQIHLFSDIALAENFLQRNSQFPQMRIWGLNAWDRIQPARITQSEAGETGYLFLPRIELRRYRDESWLYLNIAGRQDMRNAQEFLRQLVPHQEFSALQAVVVNAENMPERARWCDLIEQALDTITHRKMEKVVMARKTQLELSESLAAAQFMAASRQINHRCYHFMLAFNQHEAFLASSPERLYHRKQTQLYTEALAGTVTNSDDVQQAEKLGQWLLGDKKNQHENLLVVDDICQRLQGAVVSVDVAPPDVIRLRKVQHLRRRIQGKLMSASDSDCLHRLQPTAAVAGLPREAARDFIRDSELFNRDWYAGSAGYLSCEQSEFAVSLRCAQINNNLLSLYAGAGIVMGSDPQQEWIEIENKAAGLRTLLKGEEL